MKLTTRLVGILLVVWLAACQGPPPPYGQPGKDFEGLLKPLDKPQTWLVVYSKGASLRFTPDPTGRILEDLPVWTKATASQRLFRNGVEAPWLLVKTAGGHEGFLFVDFATPVQVQSPALLALVLPGSQEATGQTPPPAGSLLNVAETTDSLALSDHGIFPLPQVRVFSRSQAETAVVAGSVVRGFRNLFQASSLVELPPATELSLLASGVNDLPTDAVLSAFKKPSLVQTKDGQPLWVAGQDLLYSPVKTGNLVYGLRNQDRGTGQDYFDGQFSSLEVWDQSLTTPQREATWRPGHLLSLTLVPNLVDSLAGLVSTRSITASTADPATPENPGDTAQVSLEEWYLVVAPAPPAGPLTPDLAYPTSLSLTHNGETINSWNLTATSLAQRFAGGQAELTGTIEVNRSLPEPPGRDYGDISEERYQELEAARAAAQVAATARFSLEIKVTKDGRFEPAPETVRLTLEGFPPNERPTDLDSLLSQIEMTSFNSFGPEAGLCPFPTIYH